MSVIGDPSLWSDLFPDQLIPDILDLVLDTWRCFEKPSPNEWEVPISLRFCSSLCNMKNKNQDLPFTIWPESSIRDSTTGEEISRIDIRFLHGYKENVYFAFECKRLRVPYGSKIRSYATEYVGADGMMCFITGKYSKGLIAGGMMAYVMDGKINSAIRDVNSAILKKCIELRMFVCKGLSSSSIKPDQPALKETRHDIDSKDFVIHHIFLPI